MNINHNEALRYIALTLAYKNCENDLNEFGKVQFKSGKFLPWLVEAVMEILKEDMKYFRGLRINVEKESDNTRIYHWRKGSSRGSIRLSTEKLLKITADTCMNYFNDSRLQIKPKSWY
jgi:hypothetical protein